MLPDRSWRSSYSTNENNPILDFYIPALENCRQYDRKSGFFSGAILSRVAAGLGALLENDGKMRLIMGCQFDRADLEAIRRGYALREALSDRLDATFTPPQTFAQLRHFEILSWLIQHGRLDIKIAVPLKSDGMPENPEQQLDPNHIFHEKVGIFIDDNGNQLVFFGSNNETPSGWELNVESFHVYCGWEGGRDAERVDEEVFRFEQLWNDFAPNVKLFDIPEAVRAKLLRYTPNSKPTWEHEQEFDTRAIDPAEPPPPEPEKLTEAERRRELEAFAPLFDLPRDPSCLDFCLKSIPVRPWPHQFKILRRVADTFPRSFLIADEVGLGKTIETGLILRYLLVSGRVERVLVLAPASVQSQWQEELREKFNLHFWSYSQGEFKDPYGTVSALSEGNPWNRHALILASSHLVRRRERAQELLEAEPWDLVVLDEAHHARRRAPKAGKDTPNSLLELMRQLRERTDSLILLSATPMQIDPIEVFDLLDLLGLHGHWRYGDNFCNYFASLSEDPNSSILEFWQEMSVDYFRGGGEPCPRMQQLLGDRDRLLGYKLQDIWQRGKRMVNPKQLCGDESFVASSRQYLSTNTPLKDLMFRHTRDTLREYYRRGLLEQDIPRRVVADNAISLERDREIPLYRAVSDYVRNFYRLAQKQDRKALGFLMTLYRKRLTSSFYAIRESLQRRLDGISITPDDLADLDDADDAIIEGLESYVEPVDPKEIEYLEELLRQFENTGEDSKLSFLLDTLRREFLERESAIVFTQYTDTMDYLRDELRSVYGDRLACYSGRGGELPVHDPDPRWRVVPKGKIKNLFRQGEIKLLLCTESASEGLNLQTCGVLVNYDLPWNPMRVEQRIGRLDRIGQRYPTVKIHNLYYDGTVEAKVYRRLRERIGLFANVVGNLQPILARVPTFIERAAMSADPEEEDVLMGEFEDSFDADPLRPSLDEMVKMDVDADLAELRRPLSPSRLTPEFLEDLFSTSKLLKAGGFEFEDGGDRVWTLLSAEGGDRDRVTFDPEAFEADPSLRLMTWGDPLFHRMRSRVAGD
ncbi:helicase-related protein [Lyngbya sp. CCY1209]|uniref:DEAD/DEAH box helicase n=1 Tax=Lyngbya sp. CCY1209 TaxID=2886103 RepID=UPI002D20D5BF|nr:helicase-related protein [Lyngbya sp. CCY1209]MEB3882222.1 DEAD/DEAH box helicase family protein [Lyngbya sp. CCY1209]